MANQVLMPKQGNTVESCFLSNWHVKENDKVEVGTLLFSYETDKAVFEFLSEVDGVVLKLLYKEGEIVDVLSPVCYIGEPGETVDIKIKHMVDEPTEKTVETIDNQRVETTEDEKIVLSNNHFASPRAKAKAHKQNIDLNRIKGSGPNGRIIDRDISLSKQNNDLAFAQDTSYTIKSLSNIRKIIGKTMMKSLQNTAQLTHTLSFDISDIVLFRKEIIKPNLPKITFNDILVYAVSRVLKNHIELNAHFIDGELRIFNHVHMAIATDTPRGLMVPVLKNVDMLTLSDISKQAKKLISQSVSGSINPDLLTGGSFTISNLGTLDIEHFTPIINPPQTGILGVNTITSRVKTDDMGRFVFYQAMGLSLTYDHQVIDGAGASRFLRDLKVYLESFSNHIKTEPFGLE
ncbi:MAG: 2-oxo acid dehydrogenase subunit E2 [Acholeplasmataceae bacterium]|nr:2-oxo acid dehydrogenase subunit E2 [Acholeplasmataceae bacterium]